MLFFVVIVNASTPSITSREEVIMINNVACKVYVFTCNSSGNPPPMYKWFDTKDDDNNVISEEQILTLAEVNRIYICQAYNTVQTVKHTDSKNYTASETTGSSYCSRFNLLNFNSIVTVKVITM